MKQELEQLLAQNDTFMVEGRSNNEARTGATFGTK